MNIKVGMWSGDGEMRERALEEKEWTSETDDFRTR